MDVIKIVSNYRELWKSLSLNQEFTISDEWGDKLEFSQNTMVERLYLFGQDRERTDEKGVYPLTIDQFRILCLASSSSRVKELTIDLSLAQRKDQTISLTSEYYRLLFQCVASMICTTSSISVLNLSGVNLLLNEVQVIFEALEKNNSIEILRIVPTYGTCAEENFYSLYNGIALSRSLKVVSLPPLAFSSRRVLNENYYLEGASVIFSNYSICRLQVVELVMRSKGNETDDLPEFFSALKGNTSVHTLILRSSSFCDLRRFFQSIHDIVMPYNFTLRRIFYFESKEEKYLNETYSLGSKLERNMRLYHLKRSKAYFFLLELISKNLISRLPHDIIHLIFTYIIDLGMKGCLFSDLFRPITYDEKAIILGPSSIEKDDPDLALLSANDKS